MTNLKLVKSAPSDGELIADALWGIAAAITESRKPERIETVVNFTDEGIADGESFGREIANLVTGGQRSIVDTYFGAKEILDEPEDVVREPSHYRQEDGLECIDFNYDLTGPWFSVVRYVWRCMDKGNPVQDLEKALRYIEIADEKELEKPADEERAAVFRTLWLHESDNPLLEQRYFTLYAIFAPYYTAAQVRLHIESLVELVGKEKNA